MLKVLGADVRPVPAVAFDDPGNYNHQVYEYISCEYFLGSKKFVSATMFPSLPRALRVYMTVF